MITSYTYYVVYVEAPLGHPGVGTFISLKTDIKDVIKEARESKKYRHLGVLRAIKKTEIY